MAETPKPLSPRSGGDHLTLRLGSWFEASASGRLAIAVVAVAVCGALALKALGVL